MNLPRPTVRSVAILVAGLPLAFLPLLFGARLWGGWAVYILAFFCAMVVDTARSLDTRSLHIEVATPAVLYIGGREYATVRVAAPDYRLTTAVEILLDLGGDLVSQAIARGVIQSDRPAELAIPLIPERRGTARILRVWMRWTGPWGLVSHQFRRQLDREIPVVPDVRSVRAAALRFFSNREFMSGLKVEKYIGDGSEFESLREFQPGYDQRSIDWKASARHHKLLSREFRAERDHQVVLAFDTGHLMGQPLDGIPKIDHAINAGLLLSYVCLKTGDRVGLYGFDAHVHSFVAPQGGVHAIRALQLGTSRFDYTSQETNFTLGLTELSRRLRRRSLVVLLTDFEDTVTAELMLENVQRMASRHLVLFVTLRDPTLEGIAGNYPAAITELNRAVAAADLVEERETVLKRLQRTGVLTVDAVPAAVSSRLLNDYLELKRRERL